MKTTTLTFIILLGLTSCVSTQKSTTNTKDYWNKVPDLTNVTYEGGDGKSIENLILIKNAENELNGVASEYAYISKIYGEKTINWKLLNQATSNFNKRKLDIITIQTIPQNETISLYFDITEFYGKF
jgi:hypothetical protein